MCLSDGAAPTPLDANAGHRPVQPLQEGLARKTQAFRLASQGFARYVIEWISTLETNLSFDSAPRYPIDNKERLACSATLEHYIKTGSIKEQPRKTSDRLWSTFCFEERYQRDASISASPTNTFGTSTSRWRGLIRFSNSFTATNILPRWILATSTCTSSSAKPTASTCG